MRESGVYMPMLETLERVRSHLDDLINEIVKYLGNFIIIGDGHLLCCTSFRFQTKTGKGVTDIFHALVGDLGAFDKVTLVVITMFAPQKESPRPYRPRGHHESRPC